MEIFSLFFFLNQSQEWKWEWKISSSYVSVCVCVPLEFQRDLQHDETSERGSELFRVFSRRKEKFVTLLLMSSTECVEIYFYF